MQPNNLQESSNSQVTNPENPAPNGTLQDIQSLTNEHASNTEAVQKAIKSVKRAATASVIIGIIGSAAAVYFSLTADPTAIIGLVLYIIAIVVGIKLRKATEVVAYLKYLKIIIGVAALQIIGGLLTLQSAGIPTLLMLLFAILALNKLYKANMTTSGAALFAKPRE